MFYYNIKKELPSFNDIINGLKSDDENNEELTLSCINEYWKILETSFNIENIN